MHDGADLARRGASLVILFLVSACAAVQPREVCVVDRAHLDFVGASVNAALVHDCDRVKLSVWPETLPINPSPWYAMALESPAGGVVEIEIDYGRHEHRYHPWISQDDGSWARLPDDAVQVAEDSVVISGRLAPGDNRIAAHPVVDFERAEAWYARWMETEPGLRRQVFGQSVDARPLEAFTLLAPPHEASRPLLVILGRSHPPEVTGAFAMDGFVSAALQESGENQTPFDLVILPMLNPDGMARGHWRTNAGLLDINRDWASRTQPETQAAWRYLVALGMLERERVVMVDFHSTRRDLVYRDAYAPEDWRAGVIEEWMAGLAAALGASAPEPRITQSANGETSKAVFNGIGALAITWETSDDAMPDAARQAGGVAYSSLQAAWR